MLKKEDIYWLNLGEREIKRVIKFEKKKDLYVEKRDWKEDKRIKEK